MQETHTHVYSAVLQCLRTDFVSRLEFRKRTQELRQLAQEESISLPMPAEWIAVLEALGYVVDLVTGDWTPADGVRYMPTEAAQRLHATAEDVQP